MKKHFTIYVAIITLIQKFDKYTLIKDYTDWKKNLGCILSSKFKKKVYHDQTGFISRMQI